AQGLSGTSDDLPATAGMGRRHRNHPSVDGNHAGRPGTLQTPVRDDAPPDDAVPQHGIRSHFFPAFLLAAPLRTASYHDPIQATLPSAGDAATSPASFCAQRKK